jgi:hypothetical protein
LQAGLVSIVEAAAGLVFRLRFLFPHPCASLSGTAQLAVIFRGLP